MIFTKEKVKDLTTNHLFADLWFLSGDSVMAFFYHYTSKLFSISSAWWAFQLNDLHRETNDCSEEEGREHSAGLEGTAVIMLIAHNIFINIQHSHFSFLYFSYIFIFFHTFPYHGGHCNHHMHCTQYIHKHTTITFFNDVLAGPGRSYILQKLCPNVDILLHNEM